MTFKLRPSLQDLILEMYYNGFTNSNIQKVYGSKLSFYINIWSLRDRGIVEISERDKDNRNTWVLTEKGEKLAKLIIKIRKLLGGDDEK